MRFYSRGKYSCQDGQVYSALFPITAGTEYFPALLECSVLPLVCFPFLTKERSSGNEDSCPELSLWSVDMGCGTVWTCASAGHKTCTGWSGRTLRSAGMRPIAATERGCTKLQGAPSCAMQSCRPCCGHGGRGLKPWSSLAPLQG